MNYKTTSDFSYKVDGQADKIDEKIYFNPISPDQLNIVNQYYSLIKEGKIEEAIKYINESKVHTFNASLFNCIGNRIASLERYYYEKYWESNHWTTDEEQKFELRNNEQYLFLNPSMVDDGETIMKATALDVDIENFQLGLVIAENMMSDFSNYVPMGTIYPEMDEENNRANMYSANPTIIKRGNYNLSVFVNPTYTTYVKNNFSELSIYVFCGLYGCEERAISQISLSSKNGSDKNVPVATSLMDYTGTLYNYDHTFELANVYDSHYDDQEITAYFNLMFTIHNTKTEIPIDKFKELVRNNDIQFLLSKID